VPVIAQAVGGKPVRTLVEGGKATLEVPGCGPVVVNAGQAGYYRTLYSRGQFAALRDGFATLAPIDQLGLMNDTWALGMAGLQPASAYLDLADATPVDADPQVWGDIVGSFGSLDAYYRGDAARQAKFRAFATAKLEPVLRRIGWEAKAGEAAPVAILREDLIDTLGDLGDATVVAEARRRHAAAKDDPAAVPAALRKTILAVVARHADAATWDELHAAAKAEKTPLVKDELYMLLSASEDEALARRALDLALTGEPGATNSAAMIERVAQLHPELAFDFALAHRERIDALVDTTSRAQYYPARGRRAQTQAMADRIRDYADKHIAEGSRRAANTAIANIGDRIRVRDQRLPEIDAWLQAQG
jgi:aminopeptidase N